MNTTITPAEKKEEEGVPGGVPRTTTTLPSQVGSSSSSMMMNARGRNGCCFALDPFEAHDVVDDSSNGSDDDAIDYSTERGMMLWNMATQPIVPSGVLFDASAATPLLGFLVHVKEAIRLRRWSQINEVVIVVDSDSKRRMCWVDNYAEYSLDDLRQHLVVERIGCGPRRYAQYSHQMYVALLQSLDLRFLGQVSRYQDRYTINGNGVGPLFLKVILSVATGDYRAGLTSSPTDPPPPSSTTTIVAPASKQDYYDAALVSGAGCDAVNGLYYRQHDDGTSYNGTHRYVRQGQWKGEKHIFYIHCCDTVSENVQHSILPCFQRKRHHEPPEWFISIVPKGSVPGLNRDLDFYTAPSVCTSSDGDSRLVTETIPPRDNWIKAPRGVDPAPVLVHTRARGERGCAAALR